MQPFLYKLRRHQWNGMPLSHWLMGSLLLGALSSWLGWFSLPLYLAPIGLGLALLLAISLQRTARRDFVAFAAAPPPAVNPQPMPPSAKLPVHVTGRFTVENKYQRFTWLQGFYRTFATREHALICLVQPSRFGLLGTSVQREVGLWYIFFEPHSLVEVRWGAVRFGDQQLSGLAVDYRLDLPKRGLLRPAKTVEETLYIGFQSEADAREALANLLYDGQHTV